MRQVFLPIPHTNLVTIGKLILLVATTVAALALISCGSNEMAEGKAFFQGKGCTECHSVSTFGLESQNKSGPDLAEAYNDVQKRFGTSLEGFLRSPTGTMQMVLTSKIKLTDDEKQNAIRLLKYAYDNKPQQKAAQ